MHLQDAALHLEPTYTPCKESHPDSVALLESDCLKRKDQSQMSTNLAHQLARDLDEILAFDNLKIEAFESGFCGLN